MPYKDPDERRAYHREWSRRYRLKHPGRQEANSRAANLRRKHETLARYGGSCACCGETETTFLAIDHIDGVWPNGVYMTGAQLWSWLRKNDYPEGFQVLCFNCNHAVAFGRVCPHQVDGG